MRSAVYTRARASQGDGAAHPAQHHPPTVEHFVRQHRRDLRRVALAFALLALAATSAAAVTWLSGDRGAGGRTDRHASPGAAAAAFRPDGTTLEDCAGPRAVQTSGRSCYEQAFANIAYRDGARVALRRLQQVGTEHGGQRDCHRLAHAVGAGALLRNGRTVGAAIAEGEATCASGFYHGVLEQVFAGVPAAELRSRATGTCDDAQVRATAFLTQHCLHGLGHGLMIYTRYDLPRALSTCGALADTDRAPCVNGVFMENMSSSYGIRSKWLRDNDLVYPCNDTAGQYKRMCYGLVSSRAAALLGQDWGKIAAVCRTAERDWVLTCFGSIGRHAAAAVQYEPARLHAVCRNGRGAEYEACLLAAANQAGSNTAGKGDSAVRICATTSGTLRGRCFADVGVVLSWVHPDAASAKQDCVRVAPSAPDARSCARGVGTVRS